MAAYLVTSYDVHDPDTYAKYNPGSMDTIMQTMMRHGGEVLSAGPDAEFLDGDARHVTVVLKFPSAEAAHAWHDDADYKTVAQHRIASTTNKQMFIAPEFVLPD